MKFGYFEKGIIKEDQIQYVVIGARYDHRWLFVRHKERQTWEIPGGHVEAGEGLTEAAERELKEETGALDFTLYSIMDYTVTQNALTTSGRLFYAAVNTLGPLSPESEIGALLNAEDLPEQLTYPLIIPHLHKTLEKFHNAL